VIKKAKKKKASEMLKRQMAFENKVKGVSREGKGGQFDIHT
jgi:hypothetical protein